MNIKLAKYFVVLFLSLLISLPTSVVFGKSNLTAEDFNAERDFRDAEVSPNGRYLATVANNSGKRTVVIRDLESSDWVVTGQFSEDIVRPSSVEWANNERLIVSMLVPKDTRRVRKISKTKEDFDIRDYAMSRKLISMDIHAENIVFLMEEQHSASRNYVFTNIVNFLPDDPKHVLIPSYRFSKYSLYKVNVYDGKAELLVKGDRRTNQIMTDLKGNPKYRFDYYSVANVIDIYEYISEDKWEKVDSLSSSNEDEGIFSTENLISFGLSPEGLLVYRVRNEDTGFYELRTREKGQKEIKVLVSLPDQSVKSLITDSRTGEFLGYTIQKDRISHRYFDKQRQQKYDDVAAQIGKDNFFYSVEKEREHRSIIYSYGPDNPGTYHLFDLKTNKISPLGRARFKMKTEELGIPAVTRYKTRDGAKIRAYILLPPEFEPNKTFPMIIFPHGGPQARDSATYDHFAQFMATRGYIVFQPNFRGSTGYGKEFEELGFKQWGGLMQDDLTDGVNYMVKKGYANPGKICIVGGSYGGYAALMGAIKTPDLYQCSVSMNGVTHLKDLINYDIRSADARFLEKTKKELFKVIGNPETDSAMLNANSPALQAKKIRIPILLIAGEKDLVVSAKQSKMMARALRSAKKKYEYLNLEHAPHNPFHYADEAELVYAKVEEFLAKHLLDEE